MFPYSKRSTCMPFIVPFEKMTDSNNNNQYEMYCPLQNNYNLNKHCNQGEIEYTDEIFHRSSLYHL